MLLFGMGTPASGHRWLRLSARPCLLQGGTVPGGGSGRTRDRHARRGIARRTAPGDAADRHRRRARRRFDGGHSLVRRLHRQGAVLRKHQHVGASGHLERRPHRRWPWRRACVSARPGSSPASRRFVAASMPTPASHDAPPSLWLGPLVLGALGVVLGVLPALAAGPIALAGGIGHRIADRRVTPRSLARLHRDVAAERADARRFGGPVRVARSTVAASVARALHAERLYSFTLAGLDALSRRIAPALQSASLRSYVLTVVVTAIALVALALGDRRRAFRRRAAGRRSSSTKAVLAALIVAGALSAAFARSSMAAVLSLGTVGYGVAVMYALLGAPDLAMTQFAVETLTVVIFVLVFYRLRGFGDLSSRLVRSRDAIVAVDRGCARHHLGVVRRRLGDDLTAGCLFRRRGAAAGPRPQRRQRHPCRFPRLRHAGRNRRCSSPSRSASVRCC